MKDLLLAIASIVFVFLLYAGLFQVVCWCLGVFGIIIKFTWLKAFAFWILCAAISIAVKGDKND